MKRKLIKRILTFALLLTMLVTMANPVSVYAEEPVADDKKTETGESTVDSQDFDEKKETQVSGGTIETELVGNEQYDTTKPVIEKVEFPQQGTTVKADETIRFYVYAYDTGTEEGELRVDARILTEGEHNFVYMNSSYDKVKNCYVCEYTLDGSSMEKVSISNVKVTDKSGNYIVQPFNENGDYKYWVSVEQQELGTIHVKKFDFNQNGQILNANDKFDILIETEETVGIGYKVYARFQHKDGSERSFVLEPIDSGNRKEFCFNSFLYIGSDESDGEWILQSVYAKKGTWGKEESLLLEGIENYKYIIKKPEIDSDTENPIITSIEVDRNGETLVAGDIVNITVGVTDNGILREKGSVVFQAVADISVDDKLSVIELLYNENAGVYQGVFEITEETYPCEWYVSQVDIYDLEYNRADTSAFMGTNYPYYVNVVNGNTFVNPTYDINLNFYALDENGSWENIQQIKKENVERRQSLKEIGIEFPEMSSNYPELKQIGWRNYNGEQITEDMQIISNLGNMSIYAQYDKTIVNVQYNSLHENGWLNSQNKKVIVSSSTTYGELRKELENAPVPEEAFSGMKFQNWTMDRYNTDDSIINGGSIYVRVNAVYDKNCIMLQYKYVDSEGRWQYTNQPTICEKEDTYGTVIKRAGKYMPDDISKEYPFDKWEVQYNGTEDTNIPNYYSYNYVYLTAKFSGKIVMPVEVSKVYDKEGCNTFFSQPTKVLVVDEGAKGKEVIKTLKEWKLPELYQGLRFKEWGFIGVKVDDTVKNGQTVGMEAVYENCIVRYLIDPMFHGEGDVGGWDDHDLEAVFCQVAEKGETLTFPKTFEGYEKVEWSTLPEEYQPGHTFIVNGNIDFYGVGTKSDTEPVNPDEPTQPSQPENPSQPSKPEQPNPPEGEKLPESEVKDILNIIQAADSGELVRIDMNGATVISKEILETTKGKDVDIQLNMDGYTWTINGKDIKAGNLKDINLKVIMDTKNIPSKTLQALAGDNPIRQLSLVHEGDFGFKASLTVNVGSEHSGQYGNLYYHDSDGKMVFINAGKINPDGNVSLEFSHASDYVIVMSDEKMSQSDVPAEISPTKSSNQNQKQSPRTGDESSGLMWLLCGIAALGMMAFLQKKRAL